MSHECGPKVSNSATKSLFRPPSGKVVTSSYREALEIISNSQTLVRGVGCFNACFSPRRRPTKVGFSSFPSRENAEIRWSMMILIHALDLFPRPNEINLNHGLWKCCFGLQSRLCSQRSRIYRDLSIHIERECPACPTACMTRQMSADLFP